MHISFEKQINNVRVIDEKRNYWMIRTFGGDLYETFYENDFVGIGFNNVPYKYIKDATKSENDYNVLKIFIENNTKYIKGEATKWANQLIAFEHHIKIGDVILIPSRNSYKLAIGIVKSETFIKEKQFISVGGASIEIPEKRKTIEWLKVKNKDDFQVEFKGLMSSHLAVTSANKFTEYIESGISSLFIKDEKIYLSIKVNQDEDINAFALNNFLTDFNYFYNEFCLENGETNTEELFIKIKLQSKGKLLLKGLGVGGMIGVACLITLCSNNNVEMNTGKNGITLKGSSDGLLPTISNFLDANQERKFRQKRFEDSMNKLKIQVTDTNSIFKSEENRNDKSGEGIKENN